MSNKLKPCPFCGSSSIRTFRKWCGGCFLIFCECEVCGVQTKGVKAYEPDNMDDFWTENKRNTEIAENRWNIRHSNIDTETINKEIARVHHSIQNIQVSMSRKEFEWLCRTINDINGKLEKRDT